MLSIHTLMWDVPTGHWEEPEKAHGDKRKPEDLQRWRELAQIGTQMEKHILPEQASINKIYGKLYPRSVFQIC